MTGVRPVTVDSEAEARGGFDSDPQFRCKTSHLERSLKLLCLALPSPKDQLNQNPGVRPGPAATHCSSHSNMQTDLGCLDWGIFKASHL